MDGDGSNFRFQSQLQPLLPVSVAVAPTLKRPQHLVAVIFPHLVHLVPEELLVIGLDAIPR